MYHILFLIKVSCCLKWLQVPIFFDMLSTLWRPHPPLATQLTPHL
jgi:hypothetical protein